MSSNKNVRYKLSPGDKTVKIPSNLGQDRFCWGVKSDSIDWIDPELGFHMGCLKSFFKIIKPRLDDFSSMTWAELQKRKSCHPMDVAKITSSSLQRLKVIFSDNIPETLYQIDIPGQGQKHRIWGKKDGNVFYLIWNDPNHKVYPTYMKNT